MALTAALVESSPYLLKYLISAASAASNTSPIEAAVAIVIPNALGVTPDLATDAGAVWATGPAGPNTIYSIVNARRLGYGNVAAGATVTLAQARALLTSVDPSNGTMGTNRSMLSCEMFITPRTTSTATVARITNDPASDMERAPVWTCDASIDTSTNPTVRVKLAQLPAHPCDAVLTIRVRHSYTF